MEWPQITMIVLLGLGVGIGLAKDGEPRDPHSFVKDIVGCAITVWLLIAGGFFN